MNAFCASENFEAFIVFRSSQPREITRKTLTPNGPVFGEQITFGLILISAALLLVRLFFPLSPASAISVASEPPIVAPPPNTSYNSVNKDAELHRPPLQHIPIIGDLKEKSNQDVRKMAYVLNQELTELQINHIQDREKLKGSPNSVAIATLDLDEQLNDDFRQQF